MILKSLSNELSEKFRLLYYFKWLKSKLVEFPVIVRYMSFYRTN
jgi:hypothetical protein